MDKFKPDYLGKTLPDDKDQMTKFLDKKYDAFNTVYDACKDESENIKDVSNVSLDTDDSLSVKINCEEEISERIKDSIKDSDILFKNNTFVVPNN